MLLIIYLLFLLAIPGIPYLAYWILKKKGYPKTGKYLASVIGLTILTLLILDIFQDQLYTKSDAKKLLAGQGISLKDEFAMSEIWHSGDGDYRRYTLQVTEDDKQSAIKVIKNASNFIVVNDSVQHSHAYMDRYLGETGIFNYENDSSFVQEYFQPNGKNYSPTINRITIQKKIKEFTVERYR